MSDPPSDLKGQIEVTGQSIIAKLRKVVTPTKGKKGTWLARLSDRNLAEVYHRLRKGQSPNHIANIALKDWGVGSESTTSKSLARSVRSFRETILSDLQLAQQEAQTGEEKEAVRNLRKRGRRALTQLDGLATWRWAIDVQAQRVELLLEREKNTLPFKMTGTEIKTLSEMLRDYNRMLMDLGILDSKPSEFNLNIKHQFDGMMSSLGKGGGLGVIQACNTFMEKMEKEALTMTVEEDGTYTLVDADGNPG